ncbi:MULTISPECIES: helix-turn-helix domain-containing protein [Desulfitobacterium]|uniref:Putative transcriptional regulator n=1 Tax=Desulfitobacterium dehalogenans (strain ATCC 51507 / DSM 9161 / JW/IU-DC1) TaxID=756499 RepID=I4A7L1_DESDJ|nr:MULTISPECIES: helix-turn-helix domain-containing protein [Desulfitobacterium]AFL99945.1 putative transcriptional regulator [Desulfitobacterium dehalogenans ATCC 51507]
MDFESKYGNCPIYYTITKMDGKWKWLILYKLYKLNIIRYNKLRDELQPIAHRTLSNQLKELAEDGLIHREQYNEVPPKVEYSLTEKGKTLIPILELMSEWGRNSMKNN